MDGCQVLRSAGLDRLANHVALRRAAHLHGIDQGQRRLALGQVVADVLAQFLGGGVVVQGIVDELERQAQVTAVTHQGLPGLLVLFGQNCRAFRACFKELGGLSKDHFQVVRFGEVGIVAVHELQHFAFRDGVGGIGENVENIHLADLDHHLERPGVEEIAHQYAGLVPEYGIGGLPPPAQCGLVHDVIMQ